MLHVSVFQKQIMIIQQALFSIIEDANDRSERIFFEEKAQYCRLRTSQDNICSLSPSFRTSIESLSKFLSLFVKEYEFIDLEVQLIGKIQNCLVGCKKQKIQLRDSHNLIVFRLYSINNTIYQWSAYRILEEAKLQYVETATFDLLHIFSSQNSHQTPFSTLHLSSKISCKQLELQLPKASLKISFLVIAADQLSTIHEYIEKNHTPNINSDLLKNPRIVQDLESKSKKFSTNQKMEMDLFIQEKNISNILPKLNEQNKSIIKQENGVKQGECSILDLDAVILRMSDHKNKTEIQEKIEGENQFEYVIKEIGARRPFSKKIQIGSSLKGDDKNQLKVERNYGILKIQSNQNYEQGPIQQIVSQGPKELIPIIKSRLKRSHNQMIHKSQIPSNQQIQKSQIQQHKIQHQISNDENKQLQIFNHQSKQQQQISNHQNRQQQIFNHQNKQQILNHQNKQQQIIYDLKKEFQFLDHEKKRQLENYVCDKGKLQYKQKQKDVEKIYTKIINVEEKNERLVKCTIQQQKLKGITFLRGLVIVLCVGIVLMISFSSIKKKKHKSHRIFK